MSDGIRVTTQQNLFTPSSPEKRTKTPNNTHPDGASLTSRANQVPVGKRGLNPPTIQQRADRPEDPEVGQVQTWPIGELGEGPTIVPRDSLELLVRTLRDRISYELSQGKQVQFYDKDTGKEITNWSVRVFSDL